jgi:hypothetical protein
MVILTSRGQFCSIFLVRHGKIDDVLMFQLCFEIIVSVNRSGQLLGGKPGSVSLLGFGGSFRGARKPVEVDGKIVASI